MSPMTHPIEAILFDLNGTLRRSISNDEATKWERVSRIIQLIGADASPQEFNALLAARARAYTDWANETLIGLDEASLWTQWMLPDWPAARIAGLALELHGLWREGNKTRVILPETKEVVLELFRRGYRLGMVSNTTSSLEAPRALQELGLSGCFDVVLLSCQTGRRKPDPTMLIDAAARMGIDPERCAYVGNRLDRDLLGARTAGYSRAVIIADPESLRQQQLQNPGLVADHYVQGLGELLDIFPVRPKEGAVEPIYNASLSTMWAKKNFPNLADFFEATRRLGVASVELNHQMNSAMFSGMDFGKHSISSLHEPCPADVSTDELKDRDWLMSSPDEECRQRGVQAIRRSIDLARDLGLPVIVVHCGMVSNDLTDEKQLRLMFEAGKVETAEYREVKQRMLEKRASLIGPCFQSVKRSLRELLDYASGSSIRLGLENRYHYYDIPVLDEMQELLGMADSSQLGFVFDVGHAQALDRLGFIDREDWLRCFSPRIVEVHLHDVIGVNDHLAPGLGEVDFDKVAAYLPADAIRTLELQAANTPEQVKAGFKCLYEHGCIKTMKEVSHAYQSTETTK